MTAQRRWSLFGASDLAAVTHHAGRKRAGGLAGNTRILTGHRTGLDVGLVAELEERHRAAGARNGAVQDGYPECSRDRM